MTRESSTIVEATAEEVSSSWDADRRRIHTTVRLRVDRLLKGAQRGAALKLRLLGGRVGRETLAVLGQPLFEPGEPVLLFLRPDWQSSDRPLVGMDKGKRRLLRDAKTGQDQYLEPGGGRLELHRVLDLVRQVNSGGQRTRP
jgi:hypothetical protein